MAGATRTVSGTSHRIMAVYSSPESLSGCKYLRAKAFCVVGVGVVFVISFAASMMSALLIVGICVIIFGLALLFMDGVSRNLSKNSRESRVGNGVNRSWNRQRRQRSSSSSSSSGNMTTMVSPARRIVPVYSLAVNADDLMWRCPEPEDWTYLPLEPPPEYFPPSTDLDATLADTALEMGRSSSEQHVISTVSRDMRSSTQILPSYDEAIASSSDNNMNASNTTAIASTSITLTASTATANTSIISTLTDTAASPVALSLSSDET